MGKEKNSEKNFFKRTFNFEYLVKYIFPFILGAASIIGIMSIQIDKLIAKRMRPFNNFQVTQFQYDIEKQIYKIENDKNDLKIIDLEKILVLYETFCEDVKNPVFDEDVKYIREIYEQLRRKQT